MVKLSVNSQTDSGQFVHYESSQDLTWIYHCPMPRRARFYFHSIMIEVITEFVKWTMSTKDQVVWYSMNLNNSPIRSQSVIDILCNNLKRISKLTVHDFQ